MLSSRGIPLEKSTLWTKSYTQAKIFISTQTPEIIMSLCKLSAALGTKSLLSSRLTLRGSMTLSIWALCKYRLGWSHHLEKPFLSELVSSFFAQTEQEEYKNIWKQGVNMAQDEKIVFNCKWIFYNKFQDVHRPKAWTAVKITREHCGPSGAAQEPRAVRHTSHLDGVTAGLPICQTPLPCWHHFCLFFSTRDQETKPAEVSLRI